MALCLLACATSTETARNGNEAERVQRLVTQCEQAEQRLSSASSEDREFCEIRAGDCRLQVNDKRDRLIRERARTDCRNAEPQLEARCIAKAFDRRDDPTLVVDFLEANIWCLEGLLGCLNDATSSTRSAAALELAKQRQATLESDPRGVAARAGVSTNRAKIDYLRGTLLANAASSCEPEPSAATCHAAAEQKLTALSTLYRESDAEYNAEGTLAFYEQAYSEAAACYTPELECLLTTLAPHDKPPEMRTLIQKNFDRLRQRQELVERLGPAMASPCIDNGVSAHRADLDSRLATFSKQPVFFFRAALHRAFFAMYASQIACLEALSTSAP